MLPGRLLACALPPVTPELNCKIAPLPTANFSAVLDWTSKRWLGQPRAEPLHHNDMRGMVAVQCDTSCPTPARGVPQSPVHLFISTVQRFCDCDGAVVRPRLFRLRRIHLEPGVSRPVASAVRGPFDLDRPGCLVCGSLFGQTIADVDKQIIFDERPPVAFDLLNLEQRS